MPTPFMHLRVAEQLAVHACAGADADGRFQAQLAANLPAFYLGHIAPDYQALANVRRSVTHFYGAHPGSRREAVDHLLAAHPQLAAAVILQPQQAVFIAGYLGHLLLDLIWHFDVVVPMFLQGRASIEPAEAHRLHLALLAYLDKEAQRDLPPQVGAELALAAPQKWAAFAPDEQLLLWRDFVSAQLRAGGQSRTIEIYAGRLGMSPEAFGMLLENERWLAEELFSRVPLTAVRECLRRAVCETEQMTAHYLRGTLQTAAAWTL